MLSKQLEESVLAIKQRTGLKPEIGLVLGSGLGKFADTLEEAVVIPYGEIPNFPRTTSPSHKGQLIIGKLGGRVVFCMQGRFHYYEGYPMTEVTYPIRVMQAMGIPTVILTNAAGGLDPAFIPGDLMVIDNHINYMGANPLIGANEDHLGPRFVDMSQAYAPELIRLAHEVAAELGQSLRQGVYVGYSGPSFETAAEIRLFQLFGGSAVGMSTVPEVIVANHGGQKVLAISCITNLGTGILDVPLSGEEVIEVANVAAERFQKLLHGIITRI